MIDPDTYEANLKTPEYLAYAKAQLTLVEAELKQAPGIAEQRVTVEVARAAAVEVASHYPDL